MRKECEEEASLPPNIIAGIVPVGAVSYRYATAKGLSTKVLRTYDLEMPRSLQPLCADGEVEEFRLLPISEVRPRGAAVGMVPNATNGETMGPNATNGETMGPNGAACPPPLPQSKPWGRMEPQMSRR